MRKPEAPKDVQGDADKPANGQNGMKERRQVIEEYIRDLKEILKRLRDKLH